MRPVDTAVEIESAMVRRCGAKRHKTELGSVVGSQQRCRQATRVLEHRSFTVGNSNGYIPSYAPMGGTPKPAKEARF